MRCGNSIICNSQNLNSSASVKEDVTSLHECVADVRTKGSLGDQEEFKYDPDPYSFIPVLIRTHFEPCGPIALISIS